jgi:hypothetical protein
MAGDWYKEIARAYDLHVNTIYLIARPALIAAGISRKQKKAHAIRRLSAWPSKANLISALLTFCVFRSIRFGMSHGPHYAIWA